MQHRLLKGFAKTGYAARGLVYVIVGGFAVAAGLGGKGSGESTRGALLELFDTGFGSVLLVAVALGLFCYAGWRFVQSLADTDDHGIGLRALAIRTGLFASACTHAGLGVWALAAALRGAGGSDGESGFVAWLLQQPFGPTLVIAAGTWIAGVGAAHAFKGLTGGYEKWFDADATALAIVRPVSTAGLLARGGLFLVTGGLLIYAGLTINPDKAGGIREALQWLRGLPFGLAIHLAAAIGLVCFGAYSMIEAVYRRIPRIAAGPGG